MLIGSLVINIESKVQPTKHAGGAKRRANINLLWQRRE